MVLLLTLPVFGWYFAGGVLRQAWLPARSALGLSGALVCFLGLLNLLCPFFSLRVAAQISSFTLLAAAFALARWRPPVSLKSLSTRELVRWDFFTLAGLCVLAYSFCVVWQNRKPDYDFWMDYPQQGLFLNNLFPPVNPFFPDLMMEGNYGRNLLIAGVACLAQRPPLEIQFLLVPLFQICTVVALASLAKEWAHSRATAVFASLIAFLGLAVGGWVGLVDLFYHHGSLAHHLIILSFLLLRRCDFSWLSILLGALATSTLAIVQVPYFGLFILGGVALLVRGLPSRRAPAALLGVALFLALVLGGPLKAVVRPSDSTGSGALNQGQRITVQFPKQQLGKIWMQPWVYWQRSCALWTLPWFNQASHDSQRQRYQYPRYAPIWTTEVLQLHWLPVYLAPLTLLVLLRFRAEFGLFWWFFGTTAYLIPGLVDFGPIHEAEYYRWQVAAALGDALAMASVLGLLWDRPGPRWLTRGLALVFLGFTLYPSCRLPAEMRSLRVAELVPRAAENWLNAQSGTLSLRPLDFEVATRLAKKSASGERLLTNFVFSPADPFTIRRESFLIGATGLASVGRQFPTAVDYVGTPPYRQSLSARTFWRRPQSGPLRALNPQWLVWESPPGFEAPARLLASLPELQLEETLELPDLQVSVYRVRTDPLPDQESPSGLALEPGQLLEGQAGQFADYHLRLQQELPPAQLWRVRYKGRDFHEDLVMQSTGTGTFSLALPSQLGAYELSFAYAEGPEWKTVDNWLPLQVVKTPTFENPAFAPPAPLKLLQLTFRDQAAIVQLAAVGRSLPRQTYRFRLLLKSQGERREGPWTEFDLGQSPNGDQAQVVLPLPQAEPGEYQSSVEYGVKGGGSSVLLGPVWSQ